MITARKLASGVLFATLALATQSAPAQVPGLPAAEGAQPPSAPVSPERILDAEVTRMTKRYSLSDDQVAQLRTILKDKQQKTRALFMDDSLSPVDLFHKLKSVREDETTRISGILNPEQRNKYEDDVKKLQSPPPLPSGLPSSSPTSVEEATPRRSASAHLPSGMKASNEWGRYSLQWEPRSRRSSN